MSGARPAPTHEEHPTTAAEAAEAMRRCGADGLRLRVRGGASKLGWGRPVGAPDVDVYTGALHRVLEHNAGDFTAAVEAGVPLLAAQAAFAEEGQMLAWDPPLGAGTDAGATVGGILATADSGPLRHRYGGVRDLVVGLQVALSDGTLARSGGKVIKNVAGYDLGKLFAGSFGTLGLVVEVVVRLHSRPALTATAIGRSSDPGAIGRGAAAAAHAPLEADCLDVAWSGGAGAVLVRFGSADPTARVGQAADLLREAGLDVEVVSGDEDDDVWEAQRASQRADPGGVAVKVSGLPARFPELVVAAEALAGSVVGRAGLGLSWVRLAAAPAGELVAAVEELRRRLVPAPCIVLDAPDEVRAKLDPWGEPPDAVELMRRVKARFDPAGVCAPGIFVGGI